MEKRNFLPFPYEFKEISDDEKSAIKRVYKAPIASECVRVGPKGYLVYKPYQNEAENIYNMPLRPSDVFVTSYQRSGTTMTQELVWLLINDLDYSTAAANPLTARYAFLEIFMYFGAADQDSYLNASINMTNVDMKKLFEIMKLWSTPATQLLADAPSPRFVKTHVPLTLLPPKILETVKVVYVARDPRDVVVSCYHHARLLTATAYSGTFKEFWSLFHNSLFTMTPYFEHVKEAWDKRHDPNLLFLFYEELSKDLPTVIRRVADFLGKQLNDGQMAKLCDHLSFKNFKNNISVNYEDLREFGLMADDESFVRKGKAGDWRDYFDEEMTQQADQWIKDNLRDTDLRFPSTDLIE
ncbi:hypothetical protein PYW07_003687 [Mythimna separata]|uniref:Sulfotransferase domain-containing protein n=1 Tax=Mythimna separata TaxID=271217 RepID=A0AAD7YQ34_MYTSE|nr:hypothetical protein PYW07_003687 [Mythimna separata]